MDIFSQALSLFHKGGPVMYLLVMCSLAVLTIAFERLSYYRTVSADASAFIVKLRPLLDNRQFHAAAEHCQNQPTVISQLALSGLEAYQHGACVSGALESAAQVAAARLRHSLNYLSTIVTLAPLLGLLGTVIGMITSFSVFNLQAGQPMAITGGVGEALIATATGLCVAVMALLAHTYFSHRLDQLVTDMEQVGALLTSRLAAPNMARRDYHEIA